MRPTSRKSALPNLYVHNLSRSYSRCTFTYMDKDKRFEMRLPSDEYERLTKLAAEREQSVASLLREAGLALWPIKGEDDGRQDVRRAAGKSGRGREGRAGVGGTEVDLDRRGQPPVPAPTPVSDGTPIDARRFKQLVAQLQANKPLQEAEEEARKRLGMDG